MSRSVPIDKCLSDALIVFAQNGEAIRPEQGHPMRLFLPGWEGNMSIKRLRRLEVSDKPYYTREETSKYTDLVTTTGKAVESYWPYATTLFDYIRRAMPYLAPGSLTADEIYAVSGYILAEGNIVDRAMVLDAQTLPRVRMPNRDGFIPDPRPESFK